MDHSDSFQIPTLIVVGIILIVCMCYALIFVNPQVTLNPFKPILPSPTVLALVLPPTWTLTPTDTPTPTFTVTPTFTPTSTPTATDTPTNTTVPTVTRTRTPRPPTIAPSPFSYRTVLKECSHSGGTFIEGTVFLRDPGEPDSNARVAFGSTPGNADSILPTGTQGRSSGYYNHVLRADGPLPGTFFVWVVDGSGRAISDPNTGRVQTNGIRNPDDAGACWRAVVDFVRK